MSTNQGYVLSYRAAWHHEVFNDFLEASIWQFLYQNAFWEDGIKNMNGTLFNLKRGQIVVTPRYLAKGFRISERVARNVIQKLEKAEMLTIKTTNKGTIITICNYNKYQCFAKTKDAQDVKPRENKRQTKDANNNKLNTVNEVNERKKDNPPTPLAIENDFEQFWQGWIPFEMSKGSKQNAKKFYIKARKETDHETIIAKRDQYLEQCRIHRSKSSHASTWINPAGRRGYADDYHTAPSKQRSNHNGDHPDSGLRNRVNATARFIDDLCGD